MKLKQSDRRGFSVRSTGAIDTKSLPTRSYKSRSHLEQYSGTAIRFGEFETLNFSIGVLPEDIALFHALYRTSIKGREDLSKILFKDGDNTSVIANIDKSYTSRVAEVFDVILKSLSIGTDFVNDEDRIGVLNDSEIKQHKYKGNIIMCTDYQFFLLQRKDEIEEKILDENPIILKSDLKNKVCEEMKHSDYLIGISDTQFDSDEELIQFIYQFDDTE